METVVNEGELCKIELILRAINTANKACVFFENIKQLKAHCWRRVNQKQMHTSRGTEWPQSRPAWSFHQILEFVCSEMLPRKQKSWLHKLNLPKTWQKNNI